MATVDAVMAEVGDRYFKGIYKRFSEARMIYMLLELCRDHVGVALYNQLRSVQTLGLTEY